MRQIKFRGLRTDGKGWIYGSLSMGGGMPYNPDITYISPHAELFELIEVDPKTVGQFTGRNYADGEKIYEGDKVGIKFEDGTWNDNSIVEYDDEFARFKLIDYTDILYGEAFFTFYDIENDMRKVGNIHEAHND